MITKRGPIHDIISRIWVGMGVNAVLIAFWQKIQQHEGPTGGPTDGRANQWSDL